MYLIEHKTASSVDASYLDKLWTDTQIALYCHYLRELGYPIVGVIYNVLLKSRLKQGKGETQEEYEARKAELAAKNKSGKSTAKRQMPETDDEFQVRLTEWYSRPEAFHREFIYLSEDRLPLSIRHSASPRRIQLHRALRPAKLFHGRNEIDSNFAVVFVR